MQPRAWILVLVVVAAGCASAPGGPDGDFDAIVEGCSAGTIEDPDRGRRTLSVDCHQASQGGQAERSITCTDEQRVELGAAWEHTAGVVEVVILDGAETEQVTWSLSPTDGEMEANSTDLGPGDQGLWRLSVGWPDRFEGSFSVTLTCAPR